MANPAPSLVPFQNTAQGANTAALYNASYTPAAASYFADPANNTYSTPAAPAADPYAQYGGQDKYNALVSGFDSQKQNIYGTANEAAKASGTGLGLNISDFVDSLSSGQKAIDTKAARNELAKQQGTAGVVGMVGRGIKSGGMMLGNRNAGSSSAVQGIADAYGQLGRQQLSGVGNQYALGNEDIKTAQDTFNTQEASGVRRLQGSKNDIVNNIVLDARDKFAQLDASMATASLPDRIAIEQEKENVRNQVLGQLQGYDSQLSQGVAGVAPTNQDQRMSEATRLGAAGTDLGADAFNFTDQAPLQLQGQGPAGSNLPIFTLARGRRTA